jgi:gliding motility-associated-like protein
MKKLLFLLTVVLLSTYCFGQTSSFTYQSANGLFCSPTTINFTQTCTGNPIAFSWNFGNGQVSNAPNPSINFTTGTFIVKLTAVFATEAITSQQTITINPAVTVSLIADKNYICQPGTINFTAASAGGASSYEWNFGDGSPISTTSSPTTSHNYTFFSTPSVTVKAIAPSGCFAIAGVSLIIQRPTITASATPNNGCIPTTVNFTASANVPIGDNVATYTWDFGDGSPIATTIAGITSHPYTAVGPFTPSLSIVTNNGCTNTTTLPPVAFGTPPIGITASSDKLIYCGNETPAFTATATNANAYTWDFGDGTITTTANNNITHRYLTLGTKNVIVTPLFNGCAGTSFNLPAINIVGVITSFNYSNTCAAKNTFNFINTTQGNQNTVVWNFGDASPNSNVLNPVHTYPPNGGWITTLTVTDNITGCSDATSVAIFAATPTLTNPDVSICKYSNTTFTINNDYTNPTKTYEWHVLGRVVGPNNTNPFTIQANTLGNFNNNFVVINNGSQYCPDTVYLTTGIQVKGPDISFTMPPSICLNDTLRMINTSVPFPATNTFVTNYWNYGISTTNDNTFQPNPVKYVAAGNYDVKFVAIDNDGCKDSLTKQITINPLPFLRIIPRSDTLCEGSNSQLIAFHTDNILWSPPTNLSCTACDTTYANPNASTKYFATATNTFGCSVKDSTAITIINDFTASPFATPIFICLNDSIPINVLPPNKIITWSPVTNITSTTTYNPTVFPKVSTTYTATLQDSTGCFTKTVPIQVNLKTLPKVDAGPDKFYPYNSTFMISPMYSPNVIRYEWTPLGTLDCTICPIVNGRALDKQTYFIKATSDSNCVATDSLTIYVDCKDANIHMPTAFTPNDDNINDTYYPLTRGIKNIKKLVIFNREGKIVFSKVNFLPNIKTLGWDGKMNGTKQKMDGYVYILEATCDTGRDVGLNGMVTLIR